LQKKICVAKIFFRVDRALTSHAVDPKSEILKFFSAGFAPVLPAPVKDVSPNMH